MLELSSISKQEENERPLFNKHTSALEPGKKRYYFVLIPHHKPYLSDSQKTKPREPKAPYCPPVVLYHNALCRSPPPFDLTLIPSPIIPSLLSRYNRDICLSREYSTGSAQASTMGQSKRRTPGGDGVLFDVPELVKDEGAHPEVAGQEQKYQEGIENAVVKPWRWLPVIWKGRPQCSAGMVT